MLGRALADGENDAGRPVPQRRGGDEGEDPGDPQVAHNPGRLRPCANDECRLFLIDHSKANAARWCSMAVCGNRMKARRHYQRIQNAQAE